MEPISVVVDRYRKARCVHQWVLVGRSSMTTSGLRDYWVCPDCNSSKYV